MLVVISQNSYQMLISCFQQTPEVPDGFAQKSYLLPTLNVMSLSLLHKTSIIFLSVTILVNCLCLTSPIYNNML